MWLMLRTPIQVSVLTGEVLGPTSEDDPAFQQVLQAAEASIQDMKERFEREYRSLEGNDKAIKDAQIGCSPPLQIFLISD